MQNVFTTAKTGALIALIVLGIIVGLKSGAGAANFSNFWTSARRIAGCRAKALTAATAFGLFVGICVAQTNSLFSADAWNNITFTAGEVKNPRRNIPLSLAFGTILVISFYLLANVAYLAALPFDAIQNAPSDRVASETANVIFPGAGATIMAVAIMISTFGCNNGLILAGARAYYAMARDGLFFRSRGRVEQESRPGVGSVIQGIWAGVLVLPRTVKTDAAGNVDRLRQSLRQPARLRHLGRAHLLHPHDRRHLRAAPEATRRRAPLQSIRLSDRARALHRRRDR